MKIYLISNQNKMATRKVSAPDCKEARKVATALWGRNGNSVICLGSEDMVRKLNPGVM